MKWFRIFLFIGYVLLLIVNIVNARNAVFNRDMFLFSLALGGCALMINCIVMEIQSWRQKIRKP